MIELILQVIFAIFIIFTIFFWYNNARDGGYFYQISDSILLVLIPSFIISLLISGVIYIIFYLFNIQFVGFLFEPCLKFFSPIALIFAVIGGIIGTYIAYKIDLVCGDNIELTGINTALFLGIIFTLLTFSKSSPDIVFFALISTCTVCYWIGFFSSSIVNELV